MSEQHAQAAAPHAAHHVNYIKIWAILCGLLVVSVTGPFLHIRVVTMITAFGIAIVKAYLVAKNFMHINIEKRFVVYMLVGMLALMLIFFGGVSPDVLKHDGARWENVAAKKWVETHLDEKQGPEGAEHEAKPEH